MKLPTKEYRTKVAHLRSENQRHGALFKGMSVEAIAEQRERLNLERSPSRVWRNMHFLVQEFECGPYLRLTLCRTMIDESGHWLANISWEEMQCIKHSLGYGPRQAVEIFPRDEDVVNVANMRHLWILPEGEILPFGWIKDSREEYRP